MKSKADFICYSPEGKAPTYRKAMRSHPVNNNI
jgi:hypothetical protein